MTPSLLTLHASTQLDVALAADRKVRLWGYRVASRISWSESKRRWFQVLVRELDWS